LSGSQCSQHSRFIHFFKTSGHLSIFEDEIRGLFPSLPNSPILDHQFSGKMDTLVYFIARKNQLKPMKIIQLFCCLIYSMPLQTLKIQSYSGMKPYLLIDFHSPFDFHKPPGRVLFS
jgi:hypothetical protein